jgi:phage repressor protein C with HTH and peptisase S24 domain
VISIDIKDRLAFGVKIKGNSMEPRIAEGDSAIVCPGWSPKSGDTVICRTMDGDVMCKIYQPKNGGELVILSSYNPAYPAMELKREEIAWIYPVGQLVQNLRRE